VINIITDPKNPNRVLYVALRRCFYSAAWVPITPNEYHDKPEDAVKACIKHAREEVWAELQERIELLRTLCEHSEFQGQQMNPCIVAKQVQELEEFTDAHTPEIDLLDEYPDSTHMVCLHPDHHDEDRAARQCRHQTGDALESSTTHDSACPRRLDQLVALAHQR